MLSRQLKIHFFSQYSSSWITQQKNQNKRWITIMLLHRTSSAPQRTQQKCISLEPHPWRSSCAVSDEKKAMVHGEMFPHGSHSVWLPKHFCLVISCCVIGWFFFVFILPTKSYQPGTVGCFTCRKPEHLEMLSCFWHRYLNEDVPLFWALSELKKKTKQNNKPPGNCRRPEKPGEKFLS